MQYLGLQNKKSINTKICEILQTALQYIELFTFYLASRNFKYKFYRFN